MKTKRTYTINASPEAMALFDQKAKRFGRSRSSQFEFDAKNEHISDGRTFTENQICDLQSSVHEITGNGKVMQLFNALLGVASGD